MPAFDPTDLPVHRLTVRRLTVAAVFSDAYTLWEEHWIHARSWLCPGDHCPVCCWQVPHPKVGFFGHVLHTSEIRWIQFGQQGLQRAYDGRDLEELESVPGTVLRITRRSWKTDVAISDERVDVHQSAQRVDALRIIAHLQRLPVQWKENDERRNAQLLTMAARAALKQLVAQQPRFGRTRALDS